jgi:hypothetical protein
MIHRALTTLAAFALVGAFALAQPVVDGTIGEGEYANTLTHEASGTVLYWTVDGDTLYMAYTMPARGWAGIGWGVQTNRKAGFDMQVVTMEGGSPVVLDYFQAAARGEPVLDTEAGGENSFTESIAMHDGGVWTVEFKRPLVTGQETDVDIVPGEPVTFTLGHGNVMDVSRAHARTDRWYIEGFVF